MENKRNTSRFNSCNNIQYKIVLLTFGVFVMIRENRRECNSVGQIQVHEWKTTFVVPSSLLMLQVWPQVYSSPSIRSNPRCLKHLKNLLVTLKLTEIFLVVTLKSAENFSILCILYFTEHNNGAFPLPVCILPDCLDHIVMENLRILWVGLKLASSS